MNLHCFRLKILYSFGTIREFLWWLQKGHLIHDLFHEHACDRVILVKCNHLNWKLSVLELRKQTTVLMFFQKCDVEHMCLTQNFYVFVALFYCFNEKYFLKNVLLLICINYIFYICHKTISFHLIWPRQAKRP